MPPLIPAMGDESLTERDRHTRLMEDFLAAGHFGILIESNPISMQTWKSRWPHLCNHNSNGVITAFRLRSEKVGRKGVARTRNGGTPLNLIDPETGCICVSPTIHEKTGIQSIAGCIKLAERSRELCSPVRVCIITYEDDGVVHGVDLGAFCIHTIDRKHMFHLRPLSRAESESSMTSQIEEKELMGTKIYYNGRCFESVGEARMAVLLDRLNVPFEYEKRSQDVVLSNGLLRTRGYRVDFTLWPNEFRKKCYLEWKRHHPTIEEQEKMACLVKERGTAGYIVWGDIFRPCIKWSTKRMDEDRLDTRGIRLMRFAPKVSASGKTSVRRTEGYHFAYNDDAIGRVWGDQGPTSDDVESEGEYSFNVALLRKHLGSTIGRTAPKKISKQKWTKLMLPGRVKRSTSVLVRDSLTERLHRFTPTDATALTFRCNPMHEDCTSPCLMEAFAYAEAFNFQSRLQTKTATDDCASHHIELA